MKVYAYRNIDSVAMKSSSGGAFLKIIDTIVNRFGNKKYAIYGAAWSQDLKVKHMRVADKKDAAIFCGSKYVRSDIGGVYPDVRKDLENGLGVIFTGTPCQIYGLKAFLKTKGQDISNLYTIDIICHGTPNPIVWEDCKNWLEREYKGNIKSVTFRDKSISWKRYPTSIELQDGRNIRYTFKTNLYIRMFLSLFIIEKRCFLCPFSNLNRNSDITLGDYWGIDNILPETYSKKGVSLILSNTEKGNCVIEGMNSNLKTEESLVETHSQEFLKYQHNLNKPTEKPAGYEDFWKNYKNHGFEWIINKYNFMSVKKCLKFYVKKQLIKMDYFDKRLS